MKHSNAMYAPAKKGIAVALSLVLAVTQAVPVAAFAAQKSNANTAGVDVAASVQAASVQADATAGTTTDGTAITDFTQDDFAKLGLAVDDSEEGLGEAPYSTETPTQVITQSEVYTAANGAHGNKYIIRNGFDRLMGVGDKETKLSDDWGEIYGGGGLWESINNFQSDNLKNYPSYGGGVESYLATNDADTVISSGGEGFSGMYAKSVECSLASGSNSKKNCIAELRAYGDTSSTTIDGVSYAGGVAVEIMKVDANGKRSHAATLYPQLRANQAVGSRFAYLDGCYVQQLESYFDIDAADVDGDGVDEILVYAGAFKDVDGERYATVNMFRFNAAYNTWDTYEIDIDAGKVSDFNTYKQSRDSQTNLNCSSVVTLASGDLDRDNKEDVAITCTPPYGKKDVSTGRCEVFSWNDEQGALVHIDGLADNAPGAISTMGPGSVGMVSANCTFGTFKAYAEDGTPTGKTVEGLIIAGYESYNNDYYYWYNDRFYHVAYRFVYYDIEKKTYVISDYKNMALEYDAQLIIRKQASHLGQDGRFAFTLAPIALCTANLKGLTDEAQNDAVLVAGDIFENFVCLSNGSSTNGLNGCTGHMSICCDHYNRSNSRDQKGTEQVWIGDVVAGSVSGSDNYAESFIGVVGVHRDEDCGKDDDYYWMDLSHYSLVNGEEKTGEEEVISESNRKNSTYGTWISLCLPDIDNDGVRLTYQDKYKVYTNPQILAVLQTTPYFGDIENSYGYLNYAGTAFGSGSGTEHSTKGYSLEGKLGVGIDIELGFLAGGRFAGELAAQGSYDYEESTSISYNISYEAHAAEGDKVVIYTTPMVYYIYEAYDEATGKTGVVSMPVSLGIQTSVVSVELYDELSADHNRTTISSLLKSTPGDPTTYLTSVDKSNEATTQDSFGLGVDGVKRAYTSTTWSGVINEEGATTTQNISVDSATSQSFEVGGTVSAEIMGGFELFGNKTVSGPVFDFAAGYTHLSVSSNSAEFEGLVDNLNEEASVYSFTWRLGVNKMNVQDLSKLDSDAKGSGDNDNFWIIGYDVKDAKSAEVPIVTGFSATETTDSSISFVWDDMKINADLYQYRVGMLGANDPDDADPTSWKLVDASATTLTWNNLMANSTYRFKIEIVDKATGLPAGLRSDVASATTLPAGMTMSVQGVQAGSKAPAAGSVLDAMSAADVAAGSTVNLSAFGSVTVDEAAQLPNYTWFIKERGGKEWESVAMYSATKADDISTYTIKDIESELDGAQLYCRVSYDQYSLQTPVIHLNVTAEETDQATTANHSRRAFKRLRVLCSEDAKSFVMRANSDSTLLVAPEPQPNAVIDVTSEIGKAAFGASIGNASNLETLLGLNAEDKAGGVNVWLTVSDISSSISKADKKAVDAAASKAGKTTGLYLDVCLYKQVMGQAVEQVHETNGAVQVQLVLPQELQTYGETASVVRLHDGAATLVKAKYDKASGTLSFASDAFSTFAIAYDDEADDPSDDEDDEGDDPSDTPAKKPSNGGTSVKTGDEQGTLLLILGATALVSAGVVITLFVISRKRRD